MRQFLPLNHPLMVQDDKLKKRFQAPELEPFFALVTLPEGRGTWLEKGHADSLRRVTTSLTDQEGVNRAISIATIEGASSTKEGLTVGRLLELTPEKDWAKRVLDDPILTPNLISPDARTAVIAVGLDDIPAQKSQNIQTETRRRLTEAFGASSVKMGGIPVVQAEISKTLGEELKNFLLLSLVASLFTLVLFFRSISSLVVPMILIVLANLISLGWMAMTGTTFTVLTSTLPVLISITVVSMSAHTMLRFASDWELAKRSSANPNPMRVLFRSYYGLLLPNTLTAVTTAVGFFAIGIAESPLIRQYGFTIGLCIFVCWFVVMGGLLPLLILFPIPKVRDWTESRARWAIFVTAHPREIVIGIAIFCGLCVYKGQHLNWSARLFDDLPKGQEARATTELVDEKMGGMIPLDIVIEKDEAAAWNDPAAIARLDELSVKWRGLPEVGSVVGPADFLRAAGKVQGRGLASTRQEAAEYSFLYSFSDDNPYKRYVTADGKAARVTLRLKDLPADQMGAFVARTEAETAKAFPGWKVSSGAMATTVHALNNELCHELIFGFWQALIMICVILGLVFRSVRWTIVAAIPNLAPVALLLGALWVVGTPIKPGIALIFSIALGISFDNTVYLLGRLRLLRDRSATRRIDVAKAWYQEGNLCLFSSMALSAGFLVFMASYFSLNQQFGVYMVVAIAGGLLGDLVFMPAMLEVFPWMLKDKKKPELKENEMSEKAVAAGLALTLLASPLALSYAQAAAAPADAKTILQKVEKNVNSTDEVATIKMVITEADGTPRDRALEIRRKGEDKKQKVLVKMNSPADLKGTALLSVGTDQWLYLPSSKQTRRIQSGKKNSSFMDSELSYEDLGTGADAQFESKVVKTEGSTAVIENKPKGESSYGKILVFVDTTKYLVNKMEYYDKAGKLLKISSFSGYKQYDKGVWRAQKIEVVNQQNKRGTVLELSDLKLNKGLEDAEFTESALSDSD